MLRIIIAGSRDFNDYDKLKSEMDKIVLRYSENDEIQIVSGRCNTGTLTFTSKDGTKVYGADGLGERYAKENNFKLNVFPANWKANGKSAGPIRNLLMAKNADMLVAFWDLKSKGTENMIKQAKSKNLEVIGFIIDRNYE